MLKERHFERSACLKILWNGSWHYFLFFSLFYYVQFLVTRQKYWMSELLKSRIYAQWWKGGASTHQKDFFSRVKIPLVCFVTHLTRESKDVSSWKSDKVFWAWVLQLDMAKYYDLQTSTRFYQIIIRVIFFQCYLITSKVDILQVILC